MGITYGDLDYKRNGRIRWRFGHVGTEWFGGHGLKSICINSWAYKEELHYLGMFRISIIMDTVFS